MQHFGDENLVPNNAHAVQAESGEHSSDEVPTVAEASHLWAHAPVAVHPSVSLKRPDRASRRCKPSAPHADLDVAERGGEPRGQTAAAAGAANAKATR